MSRKSTFFFICCYCDVEVKEAGVPYNAIWYCCFLDITLDLRTGIYKPYRKPNSSINYLHKDSNHPPSIMKNLPESIQIRLSNNSVNKETFKEAAVPYNAALKENGHNYTLNYTPNHNRHENSKANPRTEEHHDREPKHTGCQKRGKNTRTRKITWLNPPFSMNVATNFGKNFFSPLNECFPKNSKLHKIINKNTIKLSYSCMANMKQKIDNHNRKIMSNWRERGEFTRTCNCRDKTLCPLKGKCLQEGVVYKAIVTQTESMKQDIYIGMTENPFKTRCNLHNSSFGLPRQKINNHPQWTSVDTKGRRCDLQDRMDHPR